MKKLSVALILVMSIAFWAAGQVTFVVNARGQRMALPAGFYVVQTDAQQTKKIVYQSTVSAENSAARGIMLNSYSLQLNVGGNDTAFIGGGGAFGAYLTGRMYGAYATGKYGLYAVGLIAGVTALGDAWGLHAEGATGVYARSTTGGWGGDFDNVIVSGDLEIGTSYGFDQSQDVAAAGDISLAPEKSIIKIASSGNSIISLLPGNLKENRIIHIARTKNSTGTITVKYSTGGKEITPGIASTFIKIDSEWQLLGN